MPERLDLRVDPGRRVVPASPTRARGSTSTGRPGTSWTGSSRSRRREDRARRDRRLHPGLARPERGASPERGGERLLPRPRPSPTDPRTRTSTAWTSSSRCAASPERSSTAGRRAPGLAEHLTVFGTGAVNVNTASPVGAAGARASRRPRWSSCRAAARMPISASSRRALRRGESADALRDRFASRPGRAARRPRGRVLTAVVRAPDRNGTGPGGAARAWRWSEVSRPRRRRGGRPPSAAGGPDRRARARAPVSDVVGLALRDGQVDVVALRERLGARRLVTAFSVPADEDAAGAIRRQLLRGRRPRPARAGGSPSARGGREGSGAAGRPRRGPPPDGGVRAGAPSPLPAGRGALRLRGPGASEAGRPAPRAARGRRAPKPGADPRAPPGRRPRARGWWASPSTASPAW